MFFQAEEDDEADEADSDDADDKSDSKDEDTHVRIDKLFLTFKTMVASIFSSGSQSDSMYPFVFAG
uniref:Calreticulin n=1 Tax=Solanum tuberosum TaxID=4113 RepID=M0ZSL4_SOLTU